LLSEAVPVRAFSQNKCGRPWGESRPRASLVGAWGD
jgi:hypothetical protein